ncbi:MAG: hypothetical protein COS84_08975 [Armatimonadetes bacterium CG07_land_8_20_14_0_80_40_9]|nr:MAG: hypothetical protein COS84_08975 [Armatimonadetes bacterium CG07_land_8_20_14_0_80_40_9]
MFKYATYFERDVMSKRPYIKKEWCERVVSLKKFIEKQSDGRFRFWGRIPEYGNKYLRVVTLEDQETILNAFFDRNFDGGDMK